MKPKMQVRYFTLAVESLGDKYFGRRITSNPDEMLKIFKSYANRHMEHVWSAVKDIEFCQCLDDFGIVTNCDGNRELQVTIKTCSYMWIDEEAVRTERILDHYLMTYCWIY